MAGASISILGKPFAMETVCASDKLAARLDELQQDLGEGLCWDAPTTRRPVLNPDLRNTDPVTWPILAEAIRDDKVSAFHAFPLIVGSVGVGAVDLYSSNIGSLTPMQVRNAVTLASIVAHHVLRHVLSTHESETGGGERRDSGHSCRAVHRATEMVLAQLNVSAADALLIIRGHAYANSMSAREVADLVVERQLDVTSNSHDSSRSPDSSDFQDCLLRINRC